MAIFRYCTVPYVRAAFAQFYRCTVYRMLRGNELTEFPNCTRVEPLLTVRVISDSHSVIDYAIWLMKRCAYSRDKITVFDGRDAILHVSPYT